MKNKYDTAVVFLYATGNEHLLPEEFRKLIPYTTIFGWRRMDYSSEIYFVSTGISRTVFPFA